LRSAKNEMVQTVAASCAGPLIDRVFAEHPEIGAVAHCVALIVVPDPVADPVGYYRANVTGRPGTDPGCATMFLPRTQEGP
jgi:UDP-glucose 4-epimerase